MRLADCDYSQPGAYFVTVCTKDRKCLLSTIVGADVHIGPQIQLTEAGKIAERFLLSIPGIDEYAIMPNHVHMILRVDAFHSSSISGRVASWKTLVSKALGESIWQRSFYDHVIRNEQDYIAKAEYIIGNPSRWLEDDYYMTE